MAEPDHVHIADVTLCRLLGTWMMHGALYPWAMGEDDFHGWRVPWQIWPRWLRGAFVLSLLLIGVGGCRASMGSPLSDSESLAMRVIACIAGGLILIVGSWMGQWHTRRIPPERRRALLLSKAADAVGMVLAAGCFALAVFLVASAISG